MREELNLVKGKNCGLCDEEKYEIMDRKIDLLNKRDEIMSKCRHKICSSGAIEYWTKKKLKR